jgi:hypothetical protein
MPRFALPAASLVALVLVAAAWLPEPPATTTDLTGAWIVESWTGDEGTMDDPQPGLMVFTETHYSIMHVNTEEPRAPLNEESTADDVAAAYGGFTANSGRYEVDGNSFTRRAYVAKSPGYMQGWPDNDATVTFEIDGETLHMTYGNGVSSAWRRVE